METKQISTKALLEHLYQIKRLEEILYTYKKTTEKMSEEANRKGIKSHFQEPQMGGWWSYSNLNDKSVLAKVSGIVFGTIIFIILRIIWNKFGFLSGTLIGFHLVISAILGFVVFMLFKVGVIAYDKIKGNKTAKRVYKEQMQELRIAQDSDIQRVARENLEKKELQAQMNTIRVKYEEIEQSLNKLYDLNIVYPKYRGLIPICMFCEYLESGRVTQLTGHDGAYNLYENEIRLNLIIVRLEEISSKLEQIQRNQYMLYEALNEINYTANRIYDAQLQSMSKIDSMAENMEMIKYNTYVSAENTRATKQWLEWDAWRKTLNM